MLNILVKEQESNGVPFLSDIKLRTDILPDSPVQAGEWKLYIVKVGGLYLWFVKQDKQIPVTVLIGIATGTRTEKQ